MDLIGLHLALYSISSRFNFKYCAQCNLRRAEQLLQHGQMSGWVLSVALLVKVAEEETRSVEKGIFLIEISSVV